MVLKKTMEFNKHKTSKTFDVCEKALFNRSLESKEYP